ncbi:MAG: carbonic anhydrase family protein [Gammaproteobacteria bacterium]|uniref:carbonic anhydrase n=1 Tax=Rhodoferax sp. TaxID=50421 RepID=UPI0017CA6F6B|nr:carbonic anhydrase family protein [Rhodoferax sp.]MBU3897883.1 carbonic anhydrase family protein [Gammaproteobacteria bacterium]MBA3057770.1 carbonic anhydrase family protein [Rhodoferax sp.]MBU3998881.1 carbonic anhydrase family protein [Gammaproteobacteria bacterium]MBU4019454.1 carbonic anhydrase family protein [Gammaproteobacteria bacterium]MBU4080776.1 carbonic anhydrase family protein [Gammaproteobacteria bacterium]
MHKTRFHAASHGFTWLLLALAAALSNMGWAADRGPVTSESSPAAPVRKLAASAPAAKSIVDQVREAVAGGADANKRVTLVINGKEKKFITIPAGKPVVPAEAAHNSADGGHDAAQHAAPVATPKRTVNPRVSRQYIRAKAAALAGHADPANASDAKAGGHDDVHWSYQGENGPQAWGQLQPEFKMCATGQRQSPINIDESLTLQGPAEPLQLSYQPSSASVVNNGRTIQVDLQGDNSVTVRGSSYKLLQFHFHAPSEERVNGQGFAMVAHLVHQNAEGQLAVVSVLLQAGAANALIHKVWTYMPLDIHDRVRIPAGLIDMNELLPTDQRYYQFMGSLTTPPCSEGVLWLVLKQPSPVSAAQIKLFTQIFPHNARPLQPLHGRVVRDAQ